MPEANAEFWRGFKDPLLTRLVDETLVANHDLRIALARYDRANALLRDARFDQKPDRHRQRDRPRVCQRRPGPRLAARTRDTERYGVILDLIAARQLELAGHSGTAITSM